MTSFFTLMLYREYTRDKNIASSYFQKLDRSVNIIFQLVLQYINHLNRVNTNEKYGTDWNSMYWKCTILVNQFKQRQKQLDTQSFNFRQLSLLLSNSTKSVSILHVKISIQPDFLFHFTNNSKNFPSKAIRSVLMSVACESQKVDLKENAFKNTHFWRVQNALLPTAREGDVFRSVCQLFWPQRGRGVGFPACITGHMTGGSAYSRVCIRAGLHLSRDKNEHSDRFTRGCLF